MAYSHRNAMNNKRNLPLIIVGIIVTSISIVLLAFSLPILATNPEVGFTFETTDPQMRLALNLTTFGLILLPFGLFIIIRGRKRR